MKVMGMVSAALFCVGATAWAAQAADLSGEWVLGEGTLHFAGLHGAVQDFECEGGKIRVEQPFGRLSVSKLTMLCDSGRFEIEESGFEYYVGDEEPALYSARTQMRVGLLTAEGARVREDDLDGSYTFNLTKGSNDTLIYDYRDTRSSEESTLTIQLTFKRAGR